MALSRPHRKATSGIPRRTPLLFAASVLFLLTYCAPAPANAPFLATPTPFQPIPPTGTPFLPVGPTPAPSLTPAAPYQWHGVDFSDTSASIQLVFQPGAEWNGGRELPLAFRPGWPCRYEDHRACVSLHLSGRLILATIHSGVGGEGDGLRHALEGTGLNRAGLPLAAIQANLRALRGARVTVAGSTLAGSAMAESATDPRVLAAVRVPAALVDEYYRRPVDDALAMLGGLNPDLQTAIDSGRPLLAIETCGWRSDEEPWTPGVNDTSGAVYLIVIG